MLLVGRCVRYVTGCPCKFMHMNRFKQYCILTGADLLQQEMKHDLNNKVFLLLCNIILKGKIIAYNLSFSCSCRL